MAVEIVFETHSTSVDNELGRASGWSASELSELGRTQAVELGRRRYAGRLTAVFCSDLVRAAQTAAIAFADSTVPVLHDWRLRECDYGEFTGRPAEELRASRGEYLYRPYPSGESWRQATGRVERFLGDLPSRWSGQRVLVIGHIATRWGLELAINGVALEELSAESFTWKNGWEHRLDGGGQSCHLCHISPAGCGVVAARRALIPGCALFYLIRHWLNMANRAKFVPKPVKDVLRR